VPYYSLNREELQPKKDKKEAAAPVARQAPKGPDAFTNQTSFFIM
jgi:hypothetical protein